MKIVLGSVLAHDGQTIGFKGANGLSFPVTFVPEDATSERDSERGISNPAEGINVFRRDDTVVVCSSEGELTLQIPRDAKAHEIWGRTFVIRKGDNGRFELEVM